MQGKRVVVTGASSGIGCATAELLAARGASVLLLARKGARLEQVADGIIRRGGEAATFPVDLSDAAATERVATDILGRHGAPDIIFNNAGSGRWLSLLETSPDEARQMIELPYLAAFYVTRFFLPAMVERGSGQIACITSPASQLVWPNACGYIAARHALYGFTEALRAEMNGKGIDVTLITLGVVSSDYWEHNPGARARAACAVLARSGIDRGAGCRDRRQRARGAQGTGLSALARPRAGYLRPDPAAFRLTRRCRGFSRHGRGTDLALPLCGRHMTL